MDLVNELKQMSGGIIADGHDKVESLDVEVNFNRTLNTGVTYKHDGYIYTFVGDTIDLTGQVIKDNENAMKNYWTVKLLPESVNKEHYGDILRSINGFKVKVADNCFKNRSNMVVSPHLPDTIVSMKRCFSGCENLERVDKLPSNVRDLGYCFDGCKRLVNAPDIPKKVINMEGCFRWCNHLINPPSLPDGVRNMYECFYYCASMISPPNIPKKCEDMRKCFVCCNEMTPKPIIPEHIKS